jgi:hypothetical protein
MSLLPVLLAAVRYLYGVVGFTVLWLFVWLLIRGPNNAFFNSISNQNYVIFYKLICCDSV